MDRHGKFCTYCNRKTLHSREGEGSICTTCGTYSSPSQEEIVARNHKRVSEDAIRTIRTAKVVREKVQEQQSEKEFIGKLLAFALVACALLMIIIVGSVAWMFLN